MPRRTPFQRRVALVALAAIAAGASLPAAGHAAVDDLDLISMPTLLGDPPSTEMSDDATISSGGTFVAFESAGDSLSQADDNTVGNIFLRDTGSGTTTLVSRQTGTGGASAGADGTSLDPSISGDGRYVAFQSDGDNLSTEDNNALVNIFVRDTQANTTTLVSRVSGAGGAAGDGTSADPAISRDGRYVTFESDADNLSPNDDNGVRNVFVRDLVLQTTTLISRADGPAGAAADGTSGDAVISADGRRVAFESDANNLSAEDDNTRINAFVRDLVSGTTALVNRADGPTGAAGAGDANNLSIDDAGNRVAFDSAAANLAADDTDPVSDVFVRDIAAGATILVSRAAGAAGAGGGASSTDGAISGDGRHVTFESAADNLSAEDNDGVVNVFVRDLTATTTALVSRQAGATGAATAADSRDPAIGQVGRHVAFESADNGLSALDHDPTTDVFRRDVLGDPPAPVTPPAVTPPAATSPAAAGTTTTAPKKPRLSTLLASPSTRRCVSKRRMTLRLRHADQIRKLTIRVSGRRTIKTVTGRKLRAAINLTGLPRGRYTVTVTATLTDGSTQKVTRRYRTYTKSARR